MAMAHSKHSTKVPTFFIFPYIATTTEISFPAQVAPQR